MFLAVILQHDDKIFIDGSAGHVGVDARTAQIFRNEIETITWQAWQKQVMGYQLLLKPSSLIWAPFSPVPNKRCHEPWHLWFLYSYSARLLRIDRTVICLQFEWCCLVADNQPTTAMQTNEQTNTCGNNNAQIQRKIRLNTSSWLWKQRMMQGVDDIIVHATYLVIRHPWAHKRSGELMRPLCLYNPGNIKQMHVGYTWFLSCYVINDRWNRVLASTTAANYNTQFYVQGVIRFWQSHPC